MASHNKDAQAITAEAADLATSIEGLRLALLALLAPAAKATTSSRWQAPARVSPLTLTPWQSTEMQTWSRPFVWSWHLSRWTSCRSTACARGHSLGASTW